MLVSVVPEGALSNDPSCDARPDARARVGLRSAWPARMVSLNACLRFLGCFETRDLHIVWLLDSKDWRQPVQRQSYHLLADHALNVPPLLVRCAAMRSDKVSLTSSIRRRPTKITRLSSFLCLSATVWSGHGV